MDPQHRDDRIYRGLILIVVFSLFLAFVYVALQTGFSTPSPRPDITEPRGSSVAE